MQDEDGNQSLGNYFTSFYPKLCFNVRYSILKLEIGLFSNFIQQQQKICISTTLRNTKVMA